MRKIQIRLALLNSMRVATAGIASTQQPNPNVFGEIFLVQASDQVATLAMGGTVVPFKEVTLAAQLPGRIKSLAF